LNQGQHCCLFCFLGHHLKAIRARIQDRQGVDDDTAMNALHGICDNAYATELYTPGNGLGDWTDWRACDDGYAICAFKLRIESYQGSGQMDDDTALNGISVACCSLPL
jgi:hypothetical protein